MHPSHLMLLFIVSAGVFTMTPGLDTAMVLRISTGKGQRAGRAAALGICLGLLLWGTCAAFGLTALLAASQMAFNLVKWAGTVYLIYLGVRFLWKPRTSAFVARASENSKMLRKTHRGFLKGLFSNILNPKVGLFYVTFLPQFIPTGANIAVNSLLLAGIHVLITLVWFLLLATLTGQMARFLEIPRVVRTLDQLTGIIFIGFGLKLAVIRR